MAKGTTIDWAEQGDKISKCIRKSTSGKKEAVHKLRVVIKKTRSLLALVDSTKSQKSSLGKYLSYIDLVYIPTGKYRDLQIFEALLKKEKSQQARVVEKLIRRKKTKRKKEMKSALRHFPFDTFQRVSKEFNQTQKNRSSTLLDQNATRLIRNEKSKIKKALKSGRKPKNLHEIRKHLKTIKGLLEWKNDDKSLKKIHDTEQLIGEWHDMDLLVVKMKKWKNKKSGEAIQGRFISSLERKNNKHITPLLKMIRNAIL